MDARRRYRGLVRGDVLMTNHAHLVRTLDRQDSIAEVLQSVGRRYAQHFNFTRQRTGTLWEGRYKATLIDRERYLLTCYRYIGLNPVRANLLAQPSEYRWSSYRGNALCQHAALLTAHTETWHSSRRGEAAYRASFDASLGDRTLMVIRETAQKVWALDNDLFKEEIESPLQRRTRPLPRGGDHRSVVFR